MMKCEKCSKEFDYKPHIIDDVDTWGTGYKINKNFKVCDECNDIYQDALYYSEFSE